ncbi:MAG: RimJ/RimL family protein N-acetyltransferase [Granulosicoccus sp.]|jgi:RimJ/RimL family protein N-acetyltransferase
MAHDMARRQSSDEPRCFNMRPIEITDANSIADWFQQLEDISIFDRQLPLPQNHTEVTTLVESLITDQEKEKCKWFITENKDGTAVGVTGLENINMLHGHATLPMFIAAPWRRSGLGVRMASMMIDLAFKQLRLHRIATMHRADNAPSQALLSRLGFKQEGIARQSWFAQGNHFDLINAGLLKEDWLKVRIQLLQELSHSVVVNLGPNASTDWCWPGRT